MNWREEAAEKLQKYNAMRNALQNIPEELDRLEQEACAIKTARPDKIHTKNPGRKDDDLINNFVRRQELTQQYTQVQSFLRSADRALQVLPPDERLVLQRLFISREKDGLGRLCSELGVEQSSVYRKRERALRNFTIALYGVDS